MASWNEPPASVEDYIQSLSPHVRPMAELIRQLVLSTAPNLEEAIRWNTPSYKGKLLVCGFAAFQKHVLLTFWRGAELPDPKGLLAQGQGKTAMRTVKFTALEQIHEKTLRTWVKTAAALDRDEASKKKPVAV